LFVCKNWLASLPVRFTALTVSVALPVLLKVIVFVTPAVLIAWDSKLKVEGDTEIDGAELVAVPMTERVVDPPVALWLITIDADFEPALVGLKAMLILQLASGAKLLVVHVCVPGNCAASVLVIEVMVRFKVPVFRTVKTCAALVVLTACVKFKIVGVTDIPGAAIAAPLPVSDTVVGLPPALWLIEIDALLVPVLVGVNVTLIVQLAPAATLEQLLDWENWVVLDPVTLIPATVRGAVPTLATRTVREALIEPWVTFPKSILEGLIWMTGWPTVALPSLKPNW
jgi:hypothetical protein